MRVNRNVKGPRTCKILGTRWYDLGSDVDWLTYGGLWGRPAPTEEEPGRWLVIRWDPDCEVDGFPGRADALEVPWNSWRPEELRAIGAPVSRMDESGDRIPNLQWAMLCVQAYVHTWGTSGRFGGETFSGRNARTRACRFLLNLGPIR